ncbi:hypothetical protein CBM2604_U10080 [Cupriavidus taiwanensis]|nr:hypothetical protein CBM2604_U10080 [Cupriavidus taiwanensis]SOZ53068.1 hypothetical protein CBM2610_U10077 [Cupriavidus taiwanensis]
MRCFAPKFRSGSEWQIQQRSGSTSLTRDVDPSSGTLQRRELLSTTNRYNGWQTAVIPAEDNI